METHSRGRWGSSGPLFAGPGPVLPGGARPAGPLPVAQPVAQPVAALPARPVADRQAGRVPAGWKLAAIGLVVAVCLGAIGIGALPGWMKPPPVRSGGGPWPDGLQRAGLDGPGPQWPGAEQASSGPDHPATQPDRPVPEEDRRRIAALIERYAEAARTGNGRAFAACMDVERMASEVLARLPEAPPVGAERRAFVFGMRIGLERMPANDVFALMYRRPEVRRIRLADDGQEAVVYVRHWTAEGAFDVKQRFWLCRRNDDWRIFDLEDLEVGLRFSRMAAGGIPQSPRAIRQEAEAGRRVHELVRRLVEGDPDRAEALLADLERQRYRDEFEAIKRMLRSAIHVQRGQFEQAVESANQAERLHPDMPVLHLLRARAYLELGHYGFCLAHTGKYAAVLGEDYAVLELRGKVAACQGQFEQARALYLGSLDDNPHQPDLLVYLSSVLPEDDRVELGRRFLRLHKPQDWFVGVAEGLCAEWDIEGLAALIAAHEGIRPGEPSNEFYRAWIDLRRERAAQAAERMRRAVPRVTDPLEQQSYISLFVDAMCALDQPLQAYRDMPQPDHTFIQVAEKVRDDPDTLEALVAAHRRRSPADIWPLFYQAQVHLGRDQPAEAVAALDKLWAAPMGPEDREPVRDWLTVALYRTGRGLDAYRRLTPRDATFEQLGWLYFEDDDADGLARLIDLRAADAPADPSLPLWRADVAMVRKEYDKAVEVLRAVGGDVAAEHVGRHEDRLIRALLRLGRHGEALRQARASTARDGDPFWEAIVHAVRGDMDRAGDLIGRLIEEWYYDLGDFYEDADAGPALRSPAAAEFRRLHPYPPPAPPTTQPE